MQYAFVLGMRTVLMTWPQLDVQPSELGLFCWALRAVRLDLILTRAAASAPNLRMLRNLQRPQSAQTGAAHV
jgi:hypothetical protein